MAWTTEERQAYFRRRYQERKDWAVEYLGGECADCGSDDADDLVFAHSDLSVRPMIQVSSVIRAWSISRLKRMLKQQKIVLRCTSCHAEKTSCERGS
jgi:hypothetical protein